MKTSENIKMIDQTKQCCSNTLKCFGRINNMIFSLTLRQGAILIALHQIALSAFVLIVLLVGVMHVGEMQSILHGDMEDDAERRGFYDIAYGDQLLFHEGDGISTNNQKRFAAAQDLATSTVILLYTALCLVALYLVCCMALLHGAIHGKRHFVVLWIVGASFATALAVVGVIACNKYQFVVHIFGSRRAYQIFATIGILAFVYGILCVSVFALEMTVLEKRCIAGVRIRDGDKGERLLLLDRAAHSNILSASQLTKLTKNNSFQFV